VLRIVAIAAPPSAAIACAPVALPWSSQELEREALESAREQSAQALALTGRDACVLASAACGRPQQVLAPLVGTGLFTTVVIPGEWAVRRSVRRASRRWRRSGVQLHAVWS
jgi:hypothetical protein